MPWSGLIPQSGYQAVTVQWKIEKIAGGCVLPNSRVDLVITNCDGEGRPNGTTIVQAVRVLAVDSRSASAGRDLSSSSSWLVTVELTPDETQIVVPANEQGKLDLVLLAFDDYSDESAHGWQRVEEMLLQFLKNLLRV
jgi:pilus assembly protein CpaB